MEKIAFDNVYKNKKILITGHTGFKGSWLTTWLIKLGANVVGISKDIPTKPSMFEELNLVNKIKHYKEDICNLQKIKEIISNEKPDFLFHLAAQPIVSLSFKDPIGTIYSNALGTANILEVLRVSNINCIAIIITSDKAYNNIEQVWGYKENDEIGGKDIYSGSKGAAEIIIKSYYNSFFKGKKSKIKIGIGRAGNVIGGGDWAEDRIVVDCMKAWSSNKIVEIRSPNATRPWQHVLEPLSGYLNLGADLYLSDALNGQAFNFGPISEQNHTVEKLIRDLSRYWNIKEYKNAFKITGNILFHEASLLKLNCDKAMFYLNWQSNLDYLDTIRFTGEWYFDFYSRNVSMLDKTLSQIIDYEKIAKNKRLKWMV
jgi:CDP-glucose 4,6-dehydratase